MNLLKSITNSALNATNAAGSGVGMASAWEFGNATSATTPFADNFTFINETTALGVGLGDVDVSIESPLNELVANLTAGAYEITSQWLSTTLATFAAGDVAAVLPPQNVPEGAEPTQAAVTAVTRLFNYTNVDNTSTPISGNISSDGDGRLGVAELAYTTMSPCNRDNPNFNCTPDDFLEFYQGPQRLPFYKALLVTIIFGGIFITGVLGNVLVCVVIVRHSIMHTATNYYLFSLAVSDLLYLLFGLPAEVFLYWHQYPYLFGLPFCKIRAFISEASTYVSVLTIVAFSMERFLAICHPLHLYAMSGFKRALRIIAALWIISFLSAVPFGLMTGISYDIYPSDNSTMENSAFCLMIHMPEHFPLFELSFSVFFVIPMILMIVLYWRMGAQIRSRTTQQLGVQQSSMHKESRHQQSRKAVIRMLAAVVITFFICWLPFHMQRLWFLYADDNNDEISEWIFSLTGFAYYVSCTINPILYNVMSHRYRVAFKDILCGRRKSAYYANNGFARDQSSFRETTVASSLGGGYDRVQSVRVRSIRQVGNHLKDRDSVKSNNVTWSKKTEYGATMQTDIAEDPSTTTVVVVVDNGVNGRPKVYTENDAQETLINKSNETCI